MIHNKLAAVFLLTAFFCINSFAQGNSIVDAGFAPALSLANSGTNLVYSIQLDGKVLVGGNFDVVNGVIRSRVVRLNADGTLDPTFVCTQCDLTVRSFLIQPDGKILVGGFINDFIDAKMIRLNPDGSLDNTFNYPVQVTPFGESLHLKAIQPDGKILAVLRHSGFGLYDYFYRYNPDGSRDTSFALIGADVQGGQYIDAKVFPDGRTFVFGNHSMGYLALLNADGTKNNAFESPTIGNVNSTSRLLISDIALQTDGKIAVIGNFDTINGISRRNVARLNTNQGVDTSFDPAFQFNFTTNGSGGQVFAVANNKLLFGSSAFSPSFGQIQRVNYDGTFDNTFTPPTNLDFFKYMLLDASENIYVLGTITSLGEKFVKYFSNGSFDTAFSPNVELGGTVAALGLQADGKIITAGTYDKVNGVFRNKVSRINSDGTTDTGFDTANKFSETINVFAVQPDGKILVGGNFLYDGTRKYLARLNTNGSLDSAFNPVITGGGQVWSVTIQPDGKILVGGLFTTVNSTPRSSLARLNADGSLDTSFNTQLGNATIYSIAVLGDGKILIGGVYSGVNGFNRENFSRLNSDGSLDTGFNTTLTGSQNGVKRIIVQPDGKYLALSVNKIYRFQPDGSADSSFQIPTISSSGSFNDFVLLNDGSIVVGGTFLAINNQNRTGLARLNSGGELDLLTFQNGALNVTDLLLQPDGKIVVGGGFSKIENISRTGLARVSLAPFRNITSFDFDGDGRADIGVFRPSSNVWYQLLGPNYQFSETNFGAGGDLLAPADFDGDGRTDLGIFRPSTGTWWYAASGQGGAFRAVQWGQSGDVPLPSDFNGDGRADYVVYRPSNNTWYRLTDGGVSSQIYFGTAGDKPLIGDFDGDGKADPAIYRPSNGTWWYAASSQNNAFRAIQWGIAEDIPAAADYDGDGRTDTAVYRPSNGVWYILNSGNNSATIIQFGLSSDKPIPADYDGDGKADIAVYRPSTGEWYLLRTTSGFFGLQFGISSDIPIPNAFVP